MKFKVFIFFYCFIFISFLYSYDKIVSLSPYITENIFDLESGDSIIGATSFCNIEPRYKNKITIIGGMINPNYEAILLLKPDVIFVSIEDQNPNIIKNLRKISKVEIFKANRNLCDIKNNYLYLAKILNKESLAKDKIDHIETKLRLKKLNKSNFFNKKKVFFVIQENPLITAGRDTFFNDMLNYIGLENVVKESHSRYPLYSFEKLIIEKSDIFVYLTSERRKIKKKSEFLKSSFDIFLDPDICSRPTPKNFLKSVEILYDEIKRVYRK